MPFHYLGIPLVAEKLNVSFYAPFIDKIVAHICSWTRSSLSYAGRVETCDNHASSVECFCLSIILIPAIVTSRIITLCRNFY